MNKTIKRSAIFILVSVVLAFTLVFFAGCKDDSVLDPDKGSDPVISDTEPDDVSGETPDLSDIEDEPSVSEPPTAEPVIGSEDEKPDPGNSGGNNGGTTAVTTGKYTVTYITDASNASYSSKAVKTSRTENKAVLPDTPTRSGYVFKGWYTAKNGGGARITASTAISSDTSVYAYWVKNNPRAIGNNIVIGCYDSFKENQLKLVKDLGIDWVFVNYDHSNVDESTAFLDTIASYGLKAMIHDGDLYECLASQNCTTQQVKDIMSAYINHGAYYASWLEDEPNVARATGQVKNFVAAYPNTLIMAEMVGPQGAHVYAGEGNMVQTAANYKNWITDFIKNSNTNIFCDGIYPIIGQGITSKVDDRWLIGLITGSEVAKEYNIAHSMYICCTSGVFEQGMHSFNEKDMRFQGFGALATGSSKVNYFMLEGPGSSNYVITGTAPTTQYPYIAEFNSDAHSISSVYSKYNWEYAVGITSAKNPEVYVSCIDQYSSATAASAKYVKSIVQDVSTERNLLIGAFSEIGGSGNAVFFVNEDNPNAVTSRKAEVTFKAAGAEKVTAYLDGQAGKGMVATVLTPAADGTYSITIPVGDGVLVTVDYGD